MDIYNIDMYIYIYIMYICIHIYVLIFFYLYVYIYIYTHTQPRHTDVTHGQHISTEIHRSQLLFRMPVNGAHRDPIISNYIIGNQVFEIDEYTHQAEHTIDPPQGQKQFIGHVLVQRQTVMINITQT